MGRWSRTTPCERAACWVSLSLDDELSELELAALTRHLETCARCTELAHGFASFTTLLREAPVEPSMLPVAVVAPVASRRRVRRALVAASICAALAGTAAVLLPEAAPGPKPQAASLVSSAQLSRFVRAEHARIVVATPSSRVVTPRPPQFGARALS